MKCKTLAAAALGFLLMSCASSYQMYSGRSLPNNAVAILRQSGKGPAVVISVDGKPCEGGLTYYGIGQNRWELLPGAHRVEVDLQGYDGGVETGGPQTITFTAEPGRVYDVSYDKNYIGRARPRHIYQWPSDVYRWKPVIIPEQQVTDADRVKKNG